MLEDFARLTALWRNSSKVATDSGSLVPEVIVLRMTARESNSAFVTTTSFLRSGFSLTTY